MRGVSSNTICPDGICRVGRQSDRRGDRRYPDEVQEAVSGMRRPREWRLGGRAREGLLHAPWGSAPAPIAGWSFRTAGICLYRRGRAGGGIGWSASVHRSCAVRSLPKVSDQWRVYNCALPPTPPSAVSDTKETELIFHSRFTMVRCRTAVWHRCLERRGRRHRLVISVLYCTRGRHGGLRGLAGARGADE